MLNHAVSVAVLAGLASACPTVPHGRCTDCANNVNVCSKVQCEPHFYNYDGDATNGCEAEYRPSVVCDLPAATINGQGYTGLCLNGWGTTCGADQANYIQDQAACEEFARANGVPFTLHGSTWKLGGCAYYMGPSAATRGVFWFKSKPIGWVPPQTIRDREVKDYAYICKDGSTASLVPEASNCCEQPTPQPTPQPVQDNGCTTYTWDFGSGHCIGTQNFIQASTCPADWPNPLTKAECESFGSTPRPSWRFYQDPRYGGEVSDANRPYGCVKHSNQNLYIWNNDVSGVSTDNWWRLNCKKNEPTPPPTPQPTPQPIHDNGCTTYTWDFGSGHCIGTQNFIQVSTCPSDWPNPLTKAECESFGSTPRPSWRFYQNPTYGGEVSDANRPYGCVKHSNQNLYIWNNDTSGVSTDNWWRLNCKKDEPAPAPTPQPTPRNPPQPQCPSGYRAVTGQNTDGVGTTYTRTMADCAQKCEDRFTHSGPRNCNSFQWSATVTESTGKGQCWLFVESAPTDASTNRGPDFVFCQKEAPQCPSGYRAVTGQNSDGVGTTYTRTLADCAQKCEDRFTHSGPRDCNSFQWSPTVTESTGKGQCWLFVESAPTDASTNRGPDFVFCQKEAPASPCRTYETDLFTTDGTCLGVQNFINEDECPMDFPTPLTKDQCERFGSTARPTWNFLKDPRYGGEVSDANRPFGCVKHTNQNLYVWNTDESGVVTDLWWQIVCKRDEVPVDCSTLSRKSKCNREGGCVWLRPQDRARVNGARPTAGVCHSEEGVECSHFSRRKCTDQNQRCTWGRPLGLGRNCFDSATMDCSPLARNKCQQATNVCTWNGSSCVHV